MDTTTNHTDGDGLSLNNIEVEQLDHGTPKNHNVTIDGTTQTDTSLVPDVIAQQSSHRTWQTYRQYGKQMLAYMQGWFREAFASFGLTAAAAAVVRSPQARSDASFAPIALGLVHVLLLTITGAELNPAVSVGLAASMLIRRGFEILHKKRPTNEILQNCLFQVAKSVSNVIVQYCAAVLGVLYSEMILEPLDLKLAQSSNTTAMENPDNTTAVFRNRYFRVKRFPGDLHPIRRAFLAEVFVTTLFVAGAIKACGSKRGGLVVPIVIGLSLTACAMSGLGQLANLGASINPAVVHALSMEVEFQKDSDSDAGVFMGANFIGGLCGGVLAVVA